MRNVKVTFAVCFVLLSTVGCGGGGGSTPNSADISIGGSGPSFPIANGAPISYAFTVANAGPDASQQVNIGMVPDSGLVLGAVSCTSAGGAQCPTTMGAQTTVTTIPKNGSLTFAVTADLSQGFTGNIGITANLTSSGDPNASNDRSTATAVIVAPNSVQLQSDVGDYIGIGKNYSYTKSNSVLSVSALGNHVSVRVSGNESWTGDFVLPNSVAQLQPGTYINLTRYPFSSAATGGLSWYGEGRGCNTLTGSITVDSATYVAGELKATDFSFIQHCEGRAPALRGKVHWTAYDTTSPQGPSVIVPNGLWDAAQGATPATGNYVYLESQSGDYIGGGSTYLYTPAKSTITIGGAGARLAVSVVDVATWNGDFTGPSSSTQLVPGYYAGLQRYPFNNPATGGMSWSGYGRGCNTLTGWFVIDSIAYVAGAISSVDLRFEQHCEGGAPALHGKIHWSN